MTAHPADWTTAKPVVWLKAIRDIPLGPGGNAVALALALSADKADGRNARPGLSRLQWEAGVSRDTVVATLASLEAMRLVYCESKSTGRGHASVYWLTLHGDLDRYRQSYEDWLKARRPADKPRKGSAGGPFSRGRKGSAGGPFPAVKGPEGAHKGSGDGPVKGPQEDRTREVLTREEHTSSVLRTGAPLRAAPAENSSPNGNGNFKIISDRDDLEALETELEELLGADALEMSTITGMLADGRDPQAVINKILADRGSYGSASGYDRAEDCCRTCWEPLSKCAGHGNCPDCGYQFAGYAQPMPSGLCAWCDNKSNPAPRRETA